MRRVPEIQTSVDECADGTWQGWAMVGSNLVGYVNGPTYLDTVLRLVYEIENYAALAYMKAPDMRTASFTKYLAPTNGGS